MRTSLIEKLLMMIFVILLILRVFAVTASANANENPPLTMSDEEIIALQKIALAEAGNTTVWDMALIIQKVLNRVESDEFPNTIMEVIKQPGQFSTYPYIYNKQEPNFNSQEALRCATAGFMVNKQQLFFENTISGSWISTHKQFLFTSCGVSYYK